MVDISSELEENKSSAFEIEKPQNKNEITENPFKELMDKVNSSGYEANNQWFGEG